MKRTLIWLLAVFVATVPAVVFTTQAVAVVGSAQTISEVAEAEDTFTGGMVLPPLILVAGQFDGKQFRCVIEVVAIGVQHEEDISQDLATRLFGVDYFTAIADIKIAAEPEVNKTTTSNYMKDVGVVGLSTMRTDVDLEMRITLLVWTSGPAPPQNGSAAAADYDDLIARAYALLS